MEDNIFKRRAILVDFNLLTDKHGTPNYFLLKLCDNLEVSGYSDLIILAEDVQAAREWADLNCVGDQNLIYQTHYDWLTMSSISNRPTRVSGLSLVAGSRMKT